MRKATRETERENAMEATDVVSRDMSCWMSGWFKL